MYLGLAAPLDIYLPRAGSPRDINVPRAGSPGDKNVPRAGSPRNINKKRAISHFSKIGSIRFPDFHIVNLMLI